MSAKFDIAHEVALEAIRQEIKDATVVGHVFDLHIMHDMLIERLADTRLLPGWTYATESAVNKLLNAAFDDLVIEIWTSMKLMNGPEEPEPEPSEILNNLVGRLGDLRREAIAEDPLLDLIPAPPDEPEAVKAAASQQPPPPRQNAGGPPHPEEILTDADAEREIEQDNLFFDLKEKVEQLRKDVDKFVNREPAGKIEYDVLSDTMVVNPAAVRAALDNAAPEGELPPQEFLTGRIKDEILRLDDAGLYQQARTLMMHCTNVKAAIADEWIWDLLDQRDNPDLDHDYGLV